MMRDNNRRVQFIKISMNLEILLQMRRIQQIEFWRMHKIERRANLLWGLGLRKRLVILDDCVRKLDNFVFVDRLANLRQFVDVTHAHKHGFFWPNFYYLATIWIREVSLRIIMLIYTYTNTASCQ